MMNKTQPYQEALDAFGNSFHEFAVEPIVGGLINYSYKITSKNTGETFLLQRINQNVFKNPAAVQLNYERIWEYLRSEDVNFYIPEPKKFPGDTTLFCDSRDEYWRVFEYISGAQSFLVAQNPVQARTVAKIFGEFTAAFKDFDPKSLSVTIPKFHDLAYRYKQFTDSLHSHHFDRLKKSVEIIDELKKRERYASLYDVFIESGEFPQRVMHHDAKISNILFDEESGEVICPVDLDTCMPGYFFSDLGDMIRSMAASADENEPNMANVQIRKDYYDAILQGYLEEMEKQMTDSEKKYIHHSGLIMIYMQALRFMTDYLNGDTYYKIEYAEQNFDRAMNQLNLLKNLESLLQSDYGVRI